MHVALSPHAAATVLKSVELVLPIVWGTRTLVHLGILCCALNCKFTALGGRCRWT